VDRLGDVRLSLYGLFMIIVGYGLLAAGPRVGPAWFTSVACSATLIFGIALGYWRGSVSPVRLPRRRSRTAYRPKVQAQEPRPAGEPRRLRNGNTDHSGRPDYASGLKTALGFLVIVIAPTLGRALAWTPVTSVAVMLFIAFLGVFGLVFSCTRAWRFKGW